MFFKIKIKEKIHDIEIIEKGKDNVSIKVNKRSFGFNSSPIIDEDLSISDFAQNQKILSEKEIKATLSGKVSEIFIKEGDEIKCGQKILTLLAMKMENEIISETNGKIKKVIVKTDQSVREGEILVIFD